MPVVLVQDMSTEANVRRSHDSYFRSKHIHRYGKLAMEWMEWEASRTHTEIKHQFNDREKRFSKRNIPVDGNCKTTDTIYKISWLFFATVASARVKKLTPSTGKRMREETSCNTECCVFLSPLLSKCGSVSGKN